MNVGKNTSLRDDYTTEETVELLIVSDSELKVTGDDTGLLVVTGSVTSEFEDFSLKLRKGKRCQLSFPMGGKKRGRRTERYSKTAER